MTAAASFRLMAYARARSRRLASLGRRPGVAELERRRDGVDGDIDGAEWGACAVRLAGAVGDTPDRGNLPISLLTCRDATQWCAIDGDVERRCAAKRRPAQPDHLYANYWRVRGPGDLGN